MAGTEIRTDIVDVYVFRRLPGEHPRRVAFLQMRRTPDVALPGTWQPVMGHMEGDELAARTAVRELAEETGFQPGEQVIGFWQLEEPNTYFLHSHECFVMSPCFAAEVRPDAEPVLDHTHDAARWIERTSADRAFLWPGQRRAIEAIVRDIIAADSLVEPLLRIDPKL